MRIFILFNETEYNTAIAVAKKLHAEGHQVRLACREALRPNWQETLEVADHALMIHVSDSHAKPLVSQVSKETIRQSLLLQPSSNLKHNNLLQVSTAIIAVLIILFGFTFWITRNQDNDNEANLIAEITEVASSPVATHTTTPSVTATTTPTVTSTATPTIIPDTATPTEEVDMFDETDIPIVSIYADPPFGTAPLTVTFFNDTMGDAESYTWDLDGDGEIDSNAFEPSAMMYAEPGEYIVTLTAYTASGEEESATMTVIVYGENDEDELDAPIRPTLTPTPRVQQALQPGGAIASFSANPASGDAPLIVSFQNDTMGDAVAFSWDFNGDGLPDSTAQRPPTYTYSTAGEYTVTLNVTALDGTVATETTTVIVYEPESYEDVAIAQFSVSAQEGYAPLTVTFANESTGDISLYLWDFDGDGRTDSREQNPPPFTYETAGTYKVRLLISGAGGVADPYFIEIVVSGDSTPTETPTLTATTTSTPTPTATVTATQTNTPTATSTSVASPTPAESATATLTQTATSTVETVSDVTATATHTPTTTMTFTATWTVTPSLTATNTATATQTATVTNTATASPTSTSSPTATWTPSPTYTPTSTPIPSSTPTASD